MITTRPIQVTDAMILASSVAYPDTGETAWNSGTGYSAGQTVSYQINGFYHRFKSKQGSNTNHAPAAYPNENEWWLDLGFVNQLAAFQRDRNTQTIAASPYSVKVNPGERVGVIGIGNIDADDVTLNVYDSSDVLIKTETKELFGRDVYDWYSWTFASSEQIESTLFTNLPINSAYRFELIFTRASGDVGVGFIIPGMPIEIGGALMGGAGLRKLNYSSVERDEFGEAKLTKRRRIPSGKFQLRLEKKKLNTALRVIDDLDAEVTFYAGITEPLHGYFENTFIIGFYKDFGNTIDLPNYVQADIDVEGI